MDTLTMKNKTKEKIDEIFNEVDELKIRSEQIENQLKEKWNSELGKIEDKKNSLKDIYDKISNANDDALAELNHAFEEQKSSAEEQIGRLKEIYSKTIN